MKNLSLSPVLIMLLVSSPCVISAEEKPEEIPSLEFLEFLGEWTNEQEEWIDPLTMNQLKEESNDTDSSEGNKHE